MTATSQPSASNQYTPKLIRIDEVRSRTGLGKSTILAWESVGKFPKAVRLSKTLRLWLEADVNDWISQLHLKANQMNNGASI